MKTKFLILSAAAAVGLATQASAATYDLASPQPTTPAWNTVGGASGNSTWVDATSGVYSTATPGASDIINIDGTGTNAQGAVSSNVIVNGVYTVNDLNVSTTGSANVIAFYRSTAAGLTVTNTLDKSGSSQLNFGRNGDATFTLTLNNGINLGRGTLRFANNVAPSITGSITMASDQLSVYPTFVTQANHTLSNAVSLTGSGPGDASSKVAFQPATSTTLTLNGAVSQTSATIARNLEMSGTGTLELGGVNTYFGNTLVASGALNLLNGGETRFVLGANGVNNSISGNGTASFNGMFRIDLSGANTTADNSWSLVNVGTLIESFGANFSLMTTTGGSFTESSNVWSYVDGGNTWSFTESTGVLGVVPEPTTWALLAGSLTALVIFRRRRSV